MGLGAPSPSPVTATSVHSAQSPQRMDDIAVVICTRNRPPETTHTLNSILAGRSVPDLIIIVDQADPDTPDPLVEFEGRPGILRIHDPGTGLSRARNIGTTAAEAAGVSFVAYTDDDCTVDPGWLAGLAAAFAIDKRVALVFGSTEACVHDAEQGMIPAYSVLKSAVHQGLSAKACVEGMGACMAVRVEAWRQVGGFDEHLGAGTPLAAADDNDLSIRMLWAGLMIAETPAAVVIHAGFRDRHAATRLIAGYMRGSGAAIAKMLRLGQWEAIPPHCSHW